MNAPRVAIVTTLRDAGGMLDSFVAYHLHTGFAHLFLFFDDPSDPGLERFANHPRVTATPHDSHLRKLWTGLPEYRTGGEFADSEVMARQVFNAALAMDWARQKQCDWLLHIDADELFFTPRQSAAEHFSEIHAMAADTIRYQNFESVPEKDDIADAFREVNLFKVPMELETETVSEECHILLGNTPQIPAKRFHFYRNGKSAVRLSVPELRPSGVHKFVNANGTTRGARARGAFILHYACSGFDAFWQKYVTLGPFADQWLSSYDIRSAIGPLHLDARDIVAAGDREAARAFYRERIAIEDTERVRQLIQHGILTRIPEPGELLERISQSADSQL
jgi:hypothetical protein